MNEYGDTMIFSQYYKMIYSSVFGFSARGIIVFD